MNNEFKKSKNNNETRYVLENSATVTTGSVATAPSSLGKVQKRGNILAQEAGKEKEAPKPRNFVAKNAKMGGAGKMKDKSKTIPRHEKHKKPVAEGFNHEYDDEAGMAHSNLLTTARAVMGLLKTIKDRDNLPEWGQEKIAKAEMMLVSVWDYLQSQKQLGNDPQVEAYGRRDAYQRDYDSSVSGMGKRDSLAYRMDGGANDEGEDDSQNNYGVWINGRMWKVFATQHSANAVARSLQAKGKDAKVGLTSAPVSEQGVAEGVAGPKSCWPGHRKVGTKPGTGKNAGKRVNDCEKIKEDEVEESGLQYYTGVKKHGEKYMKAAAAAGRKGASQEELGALKDRLSKAHKGKRKGIAEGDGPELEVMDLVALIGDLRRVVMKYPRAMDKAMEPFQDEWSGDAPEGAAEAAKQLIEKALGKSIEVLNDLAFRSNYDPEEPWSLWDVDALNKHEANVYKSHQSVAEAPEDRTSYQVAKILADRGIKYDPAKEDELINAIGMVLVKELNMTPKQARNLISYDEDFVSDTLGELGNMESSVSEVAPPGWEKTVKAMKKHDNIDNPFALAWSMKNKGYKSHKKESVDPYFESLANKLDQLKKK